MVEVAERHPNVGAVVKTFGLPEEPVDVVLRNAHGDLDFNRLQFGKRYQVVQGFEASGGGAVSRGEKMHFLGCFVPFEGGLRLYFEHPKRGQIMLEFDPDAPEREGRLRMIHNLNLADFFAPVAFDFSKRGRRLLAARAVIEFHKGRL